MAEALFITREDLVKNTAVNGNVDTDNFIQFIKIAQDIHVQRILGTKLYQAIQTKITGGTLSGDYLTLVNTYIKPMLIQWSLVEYLPFAAYQISNKGVYKHNSENSITPDKNEVDFLVEKARTTAESYTQRFQDYIIFNTSKFPEYNTNTNGDVRPSHNNYLGGWNI